ncbi:hypothetical protein Tco_0496973 [Tanacetum coccineum]
MLLRVSNDFGNRLLLENAYQGASDTVMLKALGEISEFSWERYGRRSNEWGCDASMLLDPAEVMGSEKITLPNEYVPANEPYHIRKITRFAARSPLFSSPLFAASDAIA